MLHRTALKSLARHNSTQAVAQHYGVPVFPALETFQQRGIPGLLSQEAFQQAYVARTTLLASKLNTAIARHSIQPAELGALVSQNASSASKKDIFNNASLLRNTSFAMSSLGEARGEQTTIPMRATAKNLLQTPSSSLNVDNQPPLDDQKHFHAALMQSFGSLVELKTLLLESAYAINGDGFTWLVAVVKTKNSAAAAAAEPTYESLAVLNTYNAGIPENKDRSCQLIRFATENEPRQMVKNIHQSIADAQKNESNFSAEYIPLLCIDASPKVWLHDYGVFGKRQYLEQAWRSIDWDVVLQRLPLTGNRVDVVRSS